MVPAHYFRYDMASLHPIVMFVTDAQIHGFLSSCGKHKSIFERLDITDADGKPYVITSHAFRHYLNTIAKTRTAGARHRQMERPKTIEQNAAYDHTGGRQLAKRMRELHDTAAMRGPLTDTIKKLPPAERGNSWKARINTAHMTDIGAMQSGLNLLPARVTERAPAAAITLSSKETPSTKPAPNDCSPSTNHAVAVPKRSRRRHLRRSATGSRTMKRS